MGPLLGLTVYSMNVADGGALVSGIPVLMSVILPP